MPSLYVLHSAAAAAVCGLWPLLLFRKIEMRGEINIVRVKIINNKNPLQ